MHMQRDFKRGQLSCPSLGARHHRRLNCTCNCHETTVSSGNAAYVKGVPKQFLQTVHISAACGNGMAVRRLAKLLFPAEVAPITQIRGLCAIPPSVDRTVAFSLHPTAMLPPDACACIGVPSHADLSTPAPRASHWPVSPNHRVSPPCK